MPFVVRNAFLVVTFRLYLVKNFSPDLFFYQLNMASPFICKRRRRWAGAEVSQLTERDKFCTDKRHLS